MIETGGKRSLWHMMKSYPSYGYHDFIICCGYKAYVSKESSANYYLHNYDVASGFRDENRGVYWVCYFLLGLHDQLSSLIAFVASVTNAYDWNRRYVFRTGTART